MKVFYSAIVLITTLISALVFYIARTLFAVPNVLFGTIPPVIAVCCIIAGILLLLPLLLSVVFIWINRLSARVSH